MRRWRPARRTCSTGSGTATAGSPGGNGPDSGWRHPGKSDGRSWTRDDHDERTTTRTRTHPTDDAATLDSVVAVADGDPNGRHRAGLDGKRAGPGGGGRGGERQLTFSPRPSCARRRRRVSDLALALTLAPPDWRGARPGGALARQPVAGPSDRHAANRCRAVGCAIAEARGGGAVPRARASRATC